MPMSELSLQLQAISDKYDAVKATGKLDAVLEFCRIARRYNTPVLYVGKPSEDLSRGSDIVRLLMTLTKQISEDSETETKLAHLLCRLGRGDTKVIEELRARGEFGEDDITYWLRTVIGEQRLAIVDDAYAILSNGIANRETYLTKKDK